MYIECTEHIELVFIKRNFIKVKNTFVIFQQNAFSIIYFFIKLFYDINH